MVLEKINGEELKKMIIGGAGTLEVNRSQVDALNVFPVPDGDTGINMSLTMNSAVQEVKALQNSDLAAVAKAVARGSLMGARGNSGVILSQIFRGFAKGVEGKSELNGTAFASALQEGVNAAYKSVMKPVEGTILTVAKEAAKGAKHASQQTDNIIEVLEETISQAELALNKTPEMLPVLREAGVVDAGGKGFVFILKGAFYALKGENLPDQPELECASPEVKPVQEEIQGFRCEEDIHFKYCTEFMILGSNVRLASLRNALHSMGDSILVVGDDNLVKVHLHTNNPGAVIESGLKYGEIDRVKIENMREQFRKLKLQEKDGEKVKKEVVPFGVIAVTVGEGLADIFQSLGAIGVVHGGQTMNPSTEDLVRAVEDAPSQKVIILPNNSNIILTAQQVQHATKKEVIVVPTKTIPQGISAMLAFSPEEKFSVNVANMEEASKKVITGEVTYAVRDTHYNGMAIKANDILGLLNGKLVKAGRSINEVALELLKEMTREQREIITIFYGEEIGKDSADELYTLVKDQYTGYEVELQYGGQPLYYYIISVE